MMAHSWLHVACLVASTSLPGLGALVPAARPAPQRRTPAAIPARRSVLVLNPQREPPAPGRADAPTRAPATSLTVQPLRDAGGLEGRTTEGQPLNRRYSEALVKHLGDNAGGRFVVAAKSDPKAKVRLTLEGDLSHVESPAADGGAYMCVLRLWREGQPRQLIGQWAGYAETLRFLTGNLRHDPRVDQDGLLGELSKRICAMVTGIAAGDQAEAVVTLVDAASKLKRIDAVVVPEGGTGGSAWEPVVSGGAYRLRVASQDVGSVFLIALGAEGRPEALYVPQPGQELDVAPGRPVVLPPQEPIAAGEVKTPTKRELLVLVRRRGNGASPGSGLGHPAETPGAGPPDGPAPLPGSVERVGDGETPLPVCVIDGRGSRTLPSPGDPAVARLLAMAKADPPGAWVARRITVHLVPKPQK